jgi:hypothetical protein
MGHRKGRRPLITRVSTCSEFLQTRKTGCSGRLFEKKLYNHVIGRHVVMFNAVDEQSFWVIRAVNAI